MGFFEVVFVVVFTSITKAEDGNLDLKNWPEGTSITAVQEGPFCFYRSEFNSAEIAEISWKFPPTFPEIPLKGIVLLFHGCTHNGDDFFRLCEDRQVVEFLLKNNYAAVGLTSIAGRDGCWIGSWPLSRNPDARRVVKALDSFFAAFKLNISSHQPGNLPDCTQLPVFIFGGSSGGNFVSMFPYIYPVNGVIVHISPGHKSAFEDAEKAKYPPTAFMFMSGDHRWASEENINVVREILLSKGIPSNSYKIEPFPLSVDKMVDLLDTKLLNKETIIVLFNFLKEENYVGDDGRLKTDPRSSDILQESMSVVIGQGGKHIANEELINDNLEELFNSAWGEHEMSHTHFEEALAFLHGENNKRCTFSPKSREL